MGRIERGFDFLGYRFGPAAVSVAVKSVERFVARAIRLYEQEPGAALASARLDSYVRRRFRCVAGGLFRRSRIMRLEISAYEQFLWIGGSVIENL